MRASPLSAGPLGGVKRLCQAAGFLQRGVAMASSYDPRSFDHMAQDFHFLASLQRRPEFFLANLPKRRCRALDVGCGTGILARELSQQFDSVLAIDISEPMLGLARKTNSAPNIEYRWADANALAIDGEFDLIASHTTFHHLESIPRTIQALRPLLAREGMLVLVDVSREWRAPRYLSQLGAFLFFPSNLVRHGFSAAVRILRFETSPEWLDHVAADDFVPEAEFVRIYGEALPGASFSRFGYYIGVVWPGPPSREHAAQQGVERDVE